MTVRYRCGLVVGKFAPLHRGHQFVIDTALAQCNEVVVLSFAVPELTGCEATRRERWLQALYPQTTRLVLVDRLLEHDPIFRHVPRDDAGDEAQRDFISHVMRHYAKRAVDAVFTSEAYGDGFARHLEARQREWDRHAGAVRHVLVDAQRAKVPISARDIRRDVHAMKHWLDQRVYADFIERVAILGGESSGKSTLAAVLAKSFDTRCVNEYGRELWAARDGKLSLADMDAIAREQIAREEATALRSNRYLFCDTTPLTTIFYSQELFGVASCELQRLAARPYQHYVLCDPDFEFVQDGTRRDSAFRARQHAWYIDALETRVLPYCVASGSMECRVEQVRAWLRESNGLSRPAGLPQPLL